MSVRDYVHVWYSPRIQFLTPHPLHPPSRNGSTKNSIVIGGSTKNCTLIGQLFGDVVLRSTSSPVTGIGRLKKNTRILLPNKMAQILHESK